jgi:HSP20 family protein
MADTTTKVSVRTEPKVADRARSKQAWSAWEDLRREIDRMFESISRGPWMSPFRSSAFDIEPLWRTGAETAVPSVDIAETEKVYELTAELPGLEERNIEVILTSGNLTIKGEREEEREKKEKGYHLQERRFGSFERSFAMPEDVAEDKIEANFKNGVLTVTLPKKTEAIKPAKKIEVKTAA